MHSNERGCVRQVCHHPSIRKDASSAEVAVENADYILASPADKRNDESCQRGFVEPLQEEAGDHQYRASSCVDADEVKALSEVGIVVLR